MEKFEKKVRKFFKKIGDIRKNRMGFLDFKFLINAKKRLLRAKGNKTDLTKLTRRVSYIGYLVARRRG